MLRERPSVLAGPPQWSNSLHSPHWPLAAGSRHRLRRPSASYQPATLAEAVVFRNRTAVENFLALGVDPNEPEADGTTPLMRAVHGQMPGHRASC